MQKLKGSKMKDMYSIWKKMEMLNQEFNGTKDYGIP